MELRQSASGGVDADNGRDGSRLSQLAGRSETGASIYLKERKTDVGEQVGWTNRHSESTDVAIFFCLEETAP